MLALSMLLPQIIILYPVADGKDNSGYSSQSTAGQVSDLILDPRIGAAKQGGPGLTPIHLSILVQGAQGLRALLRFLFSWLRGLFTFCSLLCEHSRAPCIAAMPLSRL